MKELEMHDEIKPAPLPVDPTSLLTLQNISDLFLRFKKKSSYDVILRHVHTGI